MAADNEQNQNQDLSAPNALAEGLKRLDRRMILMTRRDDEAVLSRPRLHLARIRQMRKDRGDRVRVPEDDLALAARVEAPARHASVDPGGEPLELTRRDRWWRLPMLTAAIVMGLAGVAFYFWPHTATNRSAGTLQISGPIPAGFILIGASLVLVAIWIAARPRQ